MSNELSKVGGNKKSNTIFVNKYDVNLTNDVEEYNNTKTHGDTVLLKKIKQLIDVSKLEYVSDNINKLLNLKFTNNKLCLKERCKSPVEFVEIGDGYRVTLYVRLSVEDGDLIDNDISKSIKNQLLLLLDEAKAKNWIVVGIFCDEDYSGADDERPEWKFLLDFAENKWTDIILAKTQSRFTRLMEMVEKYLHNKFNEWHIRFVSIIDNADTADKGNKKSRQINGLVNEWAVEDQSENTRRILKSMKINGQFAGSFAPYGYMKDPNDKYHLIIDEKVAKYVKMIFSMYKHGKGYQYITRVMIQKKIPTPSQYKRLQGSKFKCCQVKDISTVIWNIDTVRKILMDEVYIGTLVQGKVERISYKNKKTRAIPKAKWIRVPNCHCPIIDMDTWNIVTKRFKGRSKPTTNGKIQIFSQKVYCSCCEKSFHKNVYKTKQYGKRAYLQCRTVKKTAGMNCDNRKSIVTEEFEKYILKEINEQIKQYYDINILQNGYYEKNVINITRKEMQLLENEKKDLLNRTKMKDNLFATLYEDRVNGILTTVEFISLKKKYNAETSVYKERIIQIDNEIKDLSNSKTEKIDKKKLFEKYKNGVDKLDIVVLNEFISKIMVGKVHFDNEEQKTKRPIKIIWNICTN